MSTWQRPLSGEPSPLGSFDSVPGRIAVNGVPLGEGDVTASTYHRQLGGQSVTTVLTIIISVNGPTTDLTRWRKGQHVELDVTRHGATARFQATVEGVSEPPRDPGTMILIASGEGVNAGAQQLGLLAATDVPRVPTR